MRIARLFGRRKGRKDSATSEGAVLRTDAGEWAEISWEEGAALINECEYLLATDIREIEELTLRLAIEEAKAQAPLTAVDGDGPLAEILLGASPIKTDATCRLFRPIFDQNHMVSYSVLNESFGKYPQPPEEFTGKLFRVFSQSHLLEFTRRATIASDEYPGKLMHFQIVCLNHIVDVICTGPPKIFVMRR